MANQKTSKKKKSNRVWILAAAAAVVICLVLVLIPKENGGEDPAASGGQTLVLEAGESLVIPVGDITETASFYPVEVDGTQMEVLAVRDSQGTIRTAFNTCQICYGSGRGYYVQEGNALVCQNCGNRFTIDQVEVETGGCNPWPIFDADKTETADSISISYDFLNESRAIFARWKS